MPYRGDITTTRAPGTKKIGPAFDSMGAVEADKFVNFLTSNIFPASGDWIQLSSRDETQRGALDDATGETLELLAESNFYPEASKALRDNAVIGNALLYFEQASPRMQEDGTTWGGLAFEAVPFANYYHLLDRDGTPLYVARKVNMPVFRAEQFFVRKGDMFKAKGRFEMDNVELAYIARPVYGETWSAEGYWLDCEMHKVVRKEKLSYFPFAASRWDTAAGENYGVGRGHLARPVAKGRNELKRQILMAAGRDLNPALLTEHESIMNLDKGTAGIMVIKPSTQNKPEYLRSGTDYQAAQAVATEDAEQIRTAFMTDLLEPSTAVERSAEGSRQRQARIVQSIAAPAASLSSDFLRPIVENVIGLARAGGRLASLDGIDAMEINFVSPFLSLQKQQSVQKVADLMNLLGNLQSVTGNETVLDSIDLDAATTYIAKNSDVPAKILKDPTPAREARASIEAMDKAVEAQKVLGADGVPQDLTTLRSQTPGLLGGLE